MKIQTLSSLLFLLPVVLQHISSAGAGEPVVVGGWRPIEDVKDPHVQQLGDFAVSEYNKEKKLFLSFVQVVNGQTQVVAGVNYRLVVEAMDGDVTHTYEAVVWEKAWEGLRNLTYFKLIEN